MAVLRVADPGVLLPARVSAAAARVAAENRSAAGLDPETAEALFAAAVRQVVGADGTLPMERRASLMRTAKRLGVRAFDATLIIAVVQQREREHAPDRRVRISSEDHTEQKAAHGRVIFLRLLATLLLASGILAVILSWILGYSTI